MERADCIRLRVKKDLQIPESALFQLADLFKDEPTERQKCRILSTLEMVLHRIKQMELFPNELRSLPIFIPDLNPSVEAGRGPDPMDETEQKRLKLLKEMLDTERKYVADLDLLLVCLDLARCLDSAVKTQHSLIRIWAGILQLFESKSSVFIHGTFNHVPELGGARGIPASILVQDGSLGCFVLRTSWAVVHKDGEIQTILSLLFSKAYFQVSLSIIKGTVPRGHLHSHVRRPRSSQQNAHDQIKSTRRHFSH